MKWGNGENDKKVCFLLGGPKRRINVVKKRGKKSKGSLLLLGFFLRWLCLGCRWLFCTFRLCGFLWGFHDLKVYLGDRAVDGVAADSLPLALSVPLLFKTDAGDREDPSSRSARVILSHGETAIVRSPADHELITRHVETFAFDRVPYLLPEERFRLDILHFFLRTLSVFRPDDELEFSHFFNLPSHAPGIRAVLRSGLRIPGWFINMAVCGAKWKALPLLAI